MRIVYLSLITLFLSSQVMADVYDEIVDKAAAEAGIVESELSGPEQGEQKKRLYRVVNEQGEVSFTDVKPSEGVVEASEIEVAPQVNTLEGKSQSRLDYEAGLDQKISEERKQWQLYRARLEAAKNTLKQAQAAQIDGKLPLDREWQRTVNGRRYLKESYQKRQFSLNKAVEEAQLRLETVKKSRP